MFVSAFIGKYEQGRLRSCNVHFNYVMLVYRDSFHVACLLHLCGWLTDLFGGTFVSVGKLDLEYAQISRF